jgi:eukaryotic-like serine/threonine-protein kinase
MSELEILTAALALSDPGKRADFLDQACADRPDLRRRLEEWLSAHDRGQHPLDRPAGNSAEYAATGPFATDNPHTRTFGPPATPAASSAPPADPPNLPVDGLPSTASYNRPDKAIGAVIGGKYKLMEEIGEGGMGCVFLAQQTDPVKRLVAVKVIKAGMDSREVLARFEAERQALALMEHPNITKVLDAGTTASGQPFFVMELVKGIPITKFCDDRKLTLRERLELFVPVCKAIQHAHQKGIIHRDLKPSNVLVAMFDDRPVPKVIDFGVAKAVGQPLTDKTMMTGFGAIVGTPEYMSPEQASLNHLDVDTRSDVYTLGVILYELLTGSTPVDRKSLCQPDLMEVLRIVREVEPSRPSDKLTASEALPRIAANRNLEPAKLTRLLRGELDWVAMKALEKDRARRYDTANGLARDIQRYLADEVVEARPPSAGYRLRKLMRKHRGPVLVILVTFFAVSLGAGVALWQAAVARAAERAANAARDQAETMEAEARAANAASQDVLKFIEEKVFAAARPQGRAGGLGREVTLRQAIDEAEPTIALSFADRPLVEVKVRRMLAVTYHHLSEWDKAEEQFEKCLAICDQKLDRRHPDYHTYVAQVALHFSKEHREGEARKLIVEAYNHYRSNAPPNDPNRLHLQILFGLLVADERGRRAEALSLIEEAVAGLTRDLPPNHPDCLKQDRVLAKVRAMTGQVAEARRMLESNLRRARETFPPGSAEIIEALKEVGSFNVGYGRPVEGTKLLEEGFHDFLALYGPDHQDIEWWLRMLSLLWSANGRDADSAKLLEEYLPRFRQRLGPGHHDTIALVINLADAYLRLNRYSEVPPLIQEVLPAAVKKPRQDPHSNVLLKANLFLAYLGLNRPEAYSLVVEILEDLWRNGSPDTIVEIVNEAGRVLKQVGRDKEYVKLQEGIVRHLRELRKRTKDALGADVLSFLETRLAASYVEAGQLAEAAALAKEQLAGARSSAPADSPQLAGLLARTGRSLLTAKAWTDAEAVLRECLTIREKKEPDVWNTFNARSMLGEALVGQKKYAEAEPLLLAGYEGMKQRAGSIPPQGKQRLSQAADRLVTLYLALGNSDETAKWRTAAAGLAKEQLATARSSVPADSLQLAALLAQTGQSLLTAKAWTDAEAVLRECLTIREKKDPDAWTTFNARSMLGEALVGQKKYAEAEPLLQTAYEGLNQRRAKIPAEVSHRLPEAAQRLVQLYDAWGKKDKAEVWRKNLEEAKAAPRPPASP